MSLVKKDWHQNVMAALELVREEVQRADKQIREAGGREMANGDKKIARLALQYSDKLDDFMFQLEKVGDSWQEIQETIDADRPEVQEVVLPTKIRATKGGYSRKVTDVAPWTNFIVRLADGSVIQESTAKAAFAKSLALFDLGKVEKLGVKLNGEPLVSRDKSVFAKYPQSVVAVKDGWFASTYCSTMTKAKFVEQFAKRFGVRVKVSITPHKMKGEDVPTPVSAPKPSRKTNVPNDGRIVEGVPFKVSQVVKACFPLVFQKKLVTADEVAYLQSKESSRQFRTGGNPVIKLDRGVDSDRVRIAATGSKKARYYPSNQVSLSFAGKKYYLSCEFAPAALTPVVAWLEGKGVSKNSLTGIVCEGEC